MKMKSKQKNYLNRTCIAICILLFTLVFIRPVYVEAGTPAIVKIPSGSDAGLDKYDITGDGIPDSIKAFSDYDEYDYYYLYVTVNGRTAYKTELNEEYASFEAKIIHLKNGRTFLYLANNFMENNSSYKIYKYSNGLFKPIINLNSNVGKQSYGTYFGNIILKVSGNTLKVYGTHHSYTLGKVSVRHEYVYKNGVLKLSPATGYIRKITQKKNNKLISSRTLTVKKSLTAYKSATSNKKYFTLRKGQKVTVDKIYYSKKSGLRVRTKYKKKYGWIKCSKKKNNGYFKYIYLPIL